MDLRQAVDVSAFPAINEEICRALLSLDLSYTGGSHRSLGIVPPSKMQEAHVDYGEVLKAMGRSEFELFASLSEGANGWQSGPVAPEDIGEDRPVDLSARQMRFLEYRHRVFFPWKVHYPLMDAAFADQAEPGHEFTPEAERLLPQTLAFIRSLPFEYVGRCVLLGLEAHDHANVHRDSKPDAPPHEFISFAPQSGKRLFLWDDEAKEKTHVDSPIYWFNDADFHGVEADPFFRYSIRVDGVFRSDFRAYVSDRILEAAG